MAAAKKWPDNLSAHQRVERARVLVPRLIDDLRELIAISEANRIIMYSPTLATQIPRSFAANAFNVFQWSALNYEIIRACALWDRPGVDRASIPTIISLIDTDECRSLVEGDLCGGERVSSPNKYVLGHMNRLERAIKIAKLVDGAKFKRELYDFRNRQIAHTLVANNTSQPESVPKFGYERRVLRASIALVENLNNAIRDSSFMFDMAIEQSRRKAHALWNRCTFDIVE